MFLSCPPRLLSCVPSRAIYYFFRFARVLHGFRWNLQKVVTAMNRLNGSILFEVGTGTRDTTEYSTRRHVGCCRDVTEVLTPDEWMYTFQSIWFACHGNAATELSTRSSALGWCICAPNWWNWHFSKFNMVAAAILDFHDKWIRHVPPWWLSVSWALY